MESQTALQNFVGNLTTSIQNILSNVQSKNGASPGRSNLILRKSRKDLQHGDIFVPSGCLKLDATQHEQVLSLMKDRCSVEESWVSKVHSDSHSSLAIYIDRPKMVGTVLREVTNQGSKYGFAKFKSAQSVSLHISKGKSAESSLLYLRLVVVKQHAHRLLEANGFHGQFSEQATSEFERLIGAEQKCYQEADTTDTPCNTDSATLRQSIISQLSSLSGETSHKNALDKNILQANKSLFYNEGADVFANLPKMIEEGQLLVGSGAFDKNLKAVKVMHSGSPTESLQDCFHIIDKQPNLSSISKHHCLHVVPHNAAFANQQTILILRNIVKTDFTQSQLLVGPVSVQFEAGAPQTSAADFFSSRLKQFKEAFDLRNGTSNEDHCDEDVHALTIASIKIDVLANAPSSPLTLESCESERSAESRMGAFILYNTARLATLVARFQTEVQQGTYPSLPPIEETDWTLLREQEEWELVYLYLATFPELVQQSVECVCPTDGKLVAKVHTHKITSFLVAFCKHLSAYYNRYHILTGKESHLLPLMFARLHLIKASYQVLQNSLQLLDIKPLTYM